MNTTTLLKFNATLACLGAFFSGCGPDDRTMVGGQAQQNEPPVESEQSFSGGEIQEKKATDAGTLDESVKRSSLNAVDASILAELDARANIGAHVVLCPNEKPILLDFHQAQFPTINEPNPQLVDIGHDVETAMEAFRKRIEHTYFLETFDSQKEVVGHPHDWVLAPLAFNNNPGVVYTFGNGCTLKQASTLQNGTYFLDESLARELSGEQLGLIWVREVLQRMESEGISHAAMIRETFRKSFQKGRENEMVDFIESPTGWARRFGYLNNSGVEFKTVGEDFIHESGDKLSRIKIVSYNTRKTVELSFRWVRGEQVRKVNRNFSCSFQKSLEAVCEPLYLKRGEAPIRLLFNWGWSQFTVIDEDGNKTGHVYKP